MSRRFLHLRRSRYAFTAHHRRTSFGVSSEADAFNEETAELLASSASPAMTTFLLSLPINPPRQVRLSGFFFYGAEPMSHQSHPLHPIVSDMVSVLNGNLREFYEERAGILEFDGNNDRSLAEALALLEIAKLYGWPPKPNE